MIDIVTSEFKRVQKRTAKKLYNQGETIYIVPCKVYPSNSNPWIGPIGLNKKDVKNEFKGFDARINSYVYYNCNSELGYYTAFYIK